MNVHQSLGVSRDVVVKDGNLFFSLCRAVDPILFTALNDVTSQQTNETEEIVKLITKLLNFCATYHNVSVIYTASDKVLFIDYDVSYLSLSKS